MVTKQVIVVRKDLNMRKGKLAAQVAHASMAFITEQLKIDESKPRPAIYRDYEFHSVKVDTIEQEWLNNSFTKVVVGAADEQELLDIASRAGAAGLKVRKIVDNGATEFHGEKTLTVCAIGPDESEKIDAVTGGLPLL